MKLNLDPDPTGGQSGGGGTAKAPAPAPASAASPDWRTSLSEDYRNSPSIAKFKSQDELAKGYINLEHEFGKPKLPAPQDNWTEKEWGELHGRLGRPEKPEQYELPEVKLEDGLEIKAENLTKWKEIFHKEGISAKAAKNILAKYFEDQNNEHKSVSAAQAATKAAAEEAMRKQFGKDYEIKLGQARGLIQRFDDCGFSELLADTKFGNDPRTLKFLSNITSVFKEDSSGSANSLGMGLPEKAKALLEVAAMKSDKEFMAKYLSGDEGCRQKWDQLHRLAYPNEKTA